MEPQPNTLPLQHITIFLEFIPDDVQDADPAAINTVSQHALADLRQEGYTLTPLYTGQRGGIELIFQTMLNVAQTISTDALVQKDAFDVLSALCTIFVTVQPIVRPLFHTRMPQKTQDHHIKTSLKIDGAEIEIVSSDIADEEHIMQLAERFLAKHPTANVKQNSVVHIRRQVPKQQRRRRK